MSKKERGRQWKQSQWERKKAEIEERWRLAPQMKAALKAKGCVLIGATWARWPSEAIELDHLPYPLPSGKVTPTEAQAIRRALHTLRMHA